MVAEIAAGGADVKPVGSCKFVGDKAGHGGLALQPESSPHRLTDTADSESQFWRNAAGNRRDSGGGQDTVDHIPERQRFVVADKIAVARYAAAGCKHIRCLEMGTGGVVHIHRIHQVGPGSDPAQFSGTTFGNNARYQMVVARSPDQVGTQGRYRQLR